MIPVRQRIEQWFERLARLVYRNRVKSLLGDLLVSADGTFTTVILKAQTYLARTRDDVLEGFEDRPAPDPAGRSRLYLSNLQNSEMVDVIREVLKKYDGEGFRVYLAGTPVVVSDLVLALNENRPEYYAVPQDRRLVAQEFLLFEGSGSDDLEEVVDAGFRKVRFTIKSPFHDAMVYKALLDRVNEYFQREFPDAEVTATGVMTLFAAMIDNVVRSMAKSYIVALTVITALMMVVYKSQSKTNPRDPDSGNR